DVFEAIKKASADNGIDPSTFMQGVLEEAVKEYLPEDRQRELEVMNTLYELARAKAREVFDHGGFNEHFTLTVFQELMKTSAFRSLYEEYIEADAYAVGVPK